MKLSYNLMSTDYTSLFFYLLHIKDLSLVVAMVCTWPLVQQNTTQLISIIASRTLDEAVHVKGFWKSYRLLGFLALHRVQVIHEAQQREMQHRWKLS